MKKLLFLIMALVLVVGLVVPAALADTYYSPDNVTTTGPNTLVWTGQGATNGELKTVICDPTNYPDGYLLWILTTDGGAASADPEPYLVLNGDTDNPYYATQHGASFHFITPYFTPDPATLTAVAYFNTTSTGNGAWVLTISHGCSGDGGYDPEQAVTVTKTADTSYIRTHNWSIDKSVDTENGYEHEGFPKIWLYTDGSGDESATWTVEVTYEGYEDSDFNVCGDIMIVNSGTFGDAVITDVEDLLAGTAIVVSWVDEAGNPVTFDSDYTLPAGAALFGTYCEDVESKIEGSNEVTVYFEVSVDGTWTPFEASDEVEIEWGDPATEVNDAVEITDTNAGFAEKYGEVFLSAEDYVKGDVITFTYTQDFAWADYGKDACGDDRYYNTATIVETEQSADATLLVNVQCYIYETAYAKGGSAICFIPTFANWGWTNPVTLAGSPYTWNLWAGAGQCNTSKGTLVGTVTVVRTAGGYITVTYNMASGYLLEETHVYAGCDQFPKVKVGKKLVDTVAPGQYYNASPVNCSTAYVIAHAVVGIPDPNFGP